MLSKGCRELFPHCRGYGHPSAIAYAPHMFEIVDDYDMFEIIEDNGGDDEEPPDRAVFGDPNLDIVKGNNDIQGCSCRNQSRRNHPT